MPWLKETGLLSPEGGMKELMQLFLGDLEVPGASLHPGPPSLPGDLHLHVCKKAATQK